MVETELVAAYLSSETDESAEVLLEQLLQDHAAPLILNIVRSKLPEAASGWNNPGANASDICNDVLLHLVQQLRSFRKSSEALPIKDFSGYVASCAYNGCNQYLREKYPARTKFKNRLRYLLNYKPQFSVWRSDEGMLLCGRAEWRPTDGPLGSTNRQAIPAPPFETGESLTPECRPEQLQRLIEEYLDTCGRPITVDQLTEVLAQVCQVREATFARERADGEICLVEILPSHGLDVVSQIELRTELQLLWAEIAQLPQNQRCALLLNMRDDRGSDALMLFCKTGVTTLHQIAELLEMEVRTLARMWDHLPLEDNAIAAQLGLNRQQVINLRKSARQRLARRMAARG